MELNHSITMQISKIGTKVPSEQTICTIRINAIAENNFTQTRLGVKSKRVAHKMQIEHDNLLFL